MTALRLKSYPEGALGLCNLRKTPALRLQQQPVAKCRNLRLKGPFQASTGTEVAENLRLLKGTGFSPYINGSDRSGFSR